MEVALVRSEICAVLSTERDGSFAGVTDDLLTTNPELFGSSDVDVISVGAPAMETTVGTWSNFCHGEQPPESHVTVLARPATLEQLVIGLLDQDLVGVTIGQRSRVR